MSKEQNIKVYNRAYEYLLSIKPEGVELDNYFYREEGSTTFTNKLGPTGIDKYDGPDCIFNFAGGSTMRNKSCEYWVGLIPDQPFTNYARDIYEEHLAYRTLNYDMFFIE